MIVNNDFNIKRIDIGKNSKNVWKKFKKKMLLFKTMSIFLHQKFNKCFT
jgi:hypothetical protein